MSEFPQFRHQTYQLSQRPTQQGRKGDWVCLNCNNLNFSFRKKCNRCKIQTREQNESALMQFYQYYGQYCQTSNNQLYYSNESSRGCQITEHSQGIANSESQKMTRSWDQQAQNLGIPLPSVSLNFDQNKKEKETPKTQNSDDSGSQQQGDWSRQFMSQYCWKNIMQQEDCDSQFIGKDSLDIWDLQMQRIISKIVI